MSLKEVNKEIFTRYGLTEDEINVYIIYLSMPQATVSYVMNVLEMEYDKVKEITEKLEQEKFLKKIEGKVPRYVPLEPYFSLFTGQSKIFRDEISEIKDNVLADQSAKYDELDGIASDAKTEVQKTVADAQTSFNTDANDQGTVATATITKARDRFEETSRKLELELHKTLDENYDNFKDECNQLESEISAKWTAHSTKFTSDNESLNEKLTTILNNFKKASDELRDSIHSTLDNLNSQVADHTANGKNDINKIIDNLLADFDKRIKDLTNEIHAQLDNHVDLHRENVNSLKPVLDSVLQKYMDRMNEVIEDLKKRITDLLNKHVEHLKSTTNKMQDELTTTLSEKQSKYVNSVSSFGNKTKLLIDNLVEITNSLSDVSKFLSSRASAFKALFISQHKHWKDVYETVKTRVSKLGSEIKEQFDSETAEYIQKTNSMTEDMNSSIKSILSKENDELKKESDDLDKFAQETVNAELEGLATDLSTETRNTLESNIQHCSETTIKLKTSVENSFNSHQGDFNTAIENHRKNVLQFNDDYRGKVDADIAQCKKLTSDDIDKKKSVAETFHKDATAQHSEHASIFKEDTDEMKEKQAEIFKNRLNTMLSNKDADKAKISNMIDEQIGLFKSECKEMNSNLLAMLDDHKDRFKEISDGMGDVTQNTIDDTIQKIKDSIAEFSLQFMSKIDDAFETSEKNEEKLTEIHDAAHAIRPVEPIKTWHLIGKPAIIHYLKDVIWRTKSSIIIVTPTAVPEILELVFSVAYERRAKKFFLTTHWDLNRYGEIIKKMSVVGNIQFRQLKTAGEYWAVVRDAEEVMLAPDADKDYDIVCIVSEQEGYAKLYSGVIGPMFQAQSTPLKL
ncbi:MAG: helix-turn-helix domain-containing protein [Promethearchaeota archaeon]